MKTAIVYAHRAGLFSQINKVITCLRIYDEVNIDWSDCIYGDCWNDLFAYNEPLSPGFDKITDYPFYDLTAACAGILYQNEGWGWRERFHPFWEKLGCKVKPYNTLASVGILVRSEGHRGEQLSDRSQSYEEYAQHIKNSDMVYLMASDQETRKWFTDRFSNIVTSGPPLNAKRSDPDWHLTKPQTPEDAIQVMKEVLTLAQCKTLIHPISNMATCALIMNPDMKSIYLK